MVLNTVVDENNVTFQIKGCLDTMTSPDLQSAIDALSPSVKKLIFDFSELDYISSAGLRVLLIAHKRMKVNGSMQISGLNESVREVFEMTGFSDIFDIV